MRMLGAGLVDRRRVDILHLGPLHAGDVCLFHREEVHEGSSILKAKQQASQLHHAIRPEAR